MKIRFFAIAAFFTVLSFAVSSHAGTANTTDGQGTWVSTKCQVPQLPQVLSRDPEAAANDLNAQMAQHNAFVAAAQQYMNCVSQEAQSDATATGQVITRSAQLLIEQMNAQVARSAALLQGK